MRKVLLVTYPVDLGSATLAANLVAMLEGRVDLAHHVFSPEETPEAGPRLGTGRKALLRLASMKGLRAACLRARAEGCTILFQQTGAALFSLPFTRGLKTWVMLDWTRKLFEPITGLNHSNPLVTALHRRMFASVTGVLPFTEPVRRCLVEDYGVAPERARKVPMPFDVERIAPATPNPAGPLRLLFVGGDFARKGGDRLVRWFLAHRGAPVELTVMTQSAVDLPPGVRVVRNDPARTAAALLCRHDLFVLPTRRDAFPLAIGEAASAGLGVVTSHHALGAREVVEEGVNGHVVEGEEALHAVLSRLVADRAAVERYKVASRRKMLARFSLAAAFSQLEEAIESRGYAATPLRPMRAS